MRRIIIYTTLGLVLLVPWAGSQEKTAALESEAKQIETLLIAPCCWRQPIADHQSEISDDMKVEIRKMLQEGKDRQAILDHYVTQYGARILSIPPQEGFNRMSYLMPIFFTILGLVIVAAVLRRWQRYPVDAPKPAVASGPPVVTEELARRIQKELDEMD